jgi:hypothetical protein
VGQRTYIREFVDRPDRWADLSDAEYRTLDQLHCLAVEHPGGTYRSLDVLRAYLPDRLRKNVGSLLERGLLVVDGDRHVHLLAWDEEQEGFDTVRDRQRRRRAIERGVWSPTVTPVTPDAVTAVTEPTVTSTASSTRHRASASSSRHEALGTEQRASRPARPNSNGRTFDDVPDDHPPMGIVEANRVLVDPEASLTEKAEARSALGLS